MLLPYLVPTTMEYREAVESDIPEMARLRVAEDAEYGSGEEALRRRMMGYFQQKHHPQHALMPRALYVGRDEEALAGYVAGHLSRRFNSDGELQWIYVAPKYRGANVAAKLLHLVATWFAEHNAKRVCVDVAPSNTRARSFYERHGARVLAPSWMLWDDIRDLVKTT